MQDDQVTSGVEAGEVGGAVSPCDGFGVPVTERVPLVTTHHHLPQLHAPAARHAALSHVTNTQLRHLTVAKDERGVSGKGIKSNT